MLTAERGIKYLQDCGAKITAPRIAILKLLENRRGHLSAEQIFIELKPGYPTLSIATVYSTAQLLAKGSMLRILSIDEKKVYYDPDMDAHGHFLCRSCRSLFDVRTGFDAMPRFVSAEGVFSVNCVEVFFYGRCLECAMLS